VHKIMQSYHKLSTVNLPRLFI